MIKYSLQIYFVIPNSNVFFGKEVFQGSFRSLFFTRLCPLSWLSFNHFHLGPFLTNRKSTPPSFCFSPLCLHEKSVIFLLDSTCRYSFHKCRLEEAGDTLEIEDFSSSSFRGTCSSLPESSIWSVEIADRVGREILLVKG